ncbi:phage protein NinX family protein [Xenorhabdus sp. KJ12.1]|uniref:phage protein NinX family protein n=1 Tax=Xenorhabdus sp. KJ12.1 TaxID=1851571 RepID=UPI000C04EA2A|nr:phage protein NinX family protein [Xenorhabdus sp. KJ12.1]PHM72200.1 hypothetical protein Xekj_00478 [Xenorhabdus sp. KJ12.1]
MRIAVENLKHIALDYAVAKSSGFIVRIMNKVNGETPTQFFNTTLEASKDTRIIILNPMTNVLLECRDGKVLSAYSPSSLWQYMGVAISSYEMSIIKNNSGYSATSCLKGKQVFWATGETHLEAACRLLIILSTGSFVDIYEPAILNHTSVKGLYKVSETN